MRPTAKIYISGVLLLGVASTVSADWNLIHPWGFLCIFAVAVFASNLKVRLPGIFGTLSVNYVFILLGITGMASGEAISIGCASALVQCLWHARGRVLPVRVAFSTMNVAATIRLCYAFYHSPLVQKLNYGTPVALMVTSLLYFVINTAGVTIVIALTERKSVVSTWRECYFWSFPFYMLAASLVWVVLSVDVGKQWLNVLVLLPVIYVIHYSYRIYMDKLDAQKKQVELSRLSGMAEVATSVLHNVGNVLNSVNVSTTIVSERIQSLRVEQITALGNTLQEHQANIADFLDHDPRGSRVLPYLINLGNYFQNERRALVAELAQLRTHVDHIKTIVSTQQSYAKVSGLAEEIQLSELADDACRILVAGFEKDKITLKRDYQPMPTFTAEKHVIMQILLNLLSNARDAVKLQESAERFVRIHVYRHDDACVRVEVSDTGIGVAPEDLTRIFSYGFTTKAQGHGFGLHSSAIDAQAMGGSLKAASGGRGCGATFTLELPFNKVAHRSAA